MSGMTSQSLFDRIAQAAREMNDMNEFGALHIFVSDGNCSDKDLDFCLSQPNITDDERLWCQKMRDEFEEDEREAVFLFAQCSDLQGGTSR